MKQVLVVAVIAAFALSACETLPTKPASGPAAAPLASSPGPLGRVWSENEAGWRGTWTREAQSNRFRANWQHPNGSVVEATLTMTLTGDQLVIVRRDTLGPGVGKGCRYTGVLQGRQARGQYSCDWSPTPAPWSAQVQ